MTTPAQPYPPAVEPSAGFAAGEASAGTTARLILLRHGRADGAEVRCAGRGEVFDPGLAPDGREQAAAAVRRLGRRFDLVVSSPARRAVETANAWNLPVRIDERLAERSFGEWEGRPWAEVGVPGSGGL
jgi:broad specificity phosphatase PhoE